MSYSLWPCGLQHSRPLCPSPSQSSSKFMSIESVMPSNHLIRWCPLFLLPSFFPSIRVFPSELAVRIRWPKYWSFSFSISASNEYSGLILFNNYILRTYLSYNWKFVPFDHLHPFCPPINCPPNFDNHQSVLWASVHLFLDFTYKWDYTVFAFLCLGYFTYHNTCKSIHVIANGRIPFFIMVE